MSNGSTVGKAACSLLTCICAGAILFTAALALAQERAGDNARRAAAEPHLFGGIARWFDRQAAKIGSGFKDAGSQVENFGHEAGIAAKTTVAGAKGAADSVARIPSARVVKGHVKCKVAPNGAPDCLAAAHALCRTKGFESGKSVDMTTAEVCPAEVYLSGRNSGAGCHAETFVSRVLCQ
ncbi:MAG: hypothetical protein ACREB8_10545 [Pseudolabrys sp.]